jgi:hypothetical protein
MTVLALEGSFASVLGGAPAAAVVFSGEVSKRTAADPLGVWAAGPGRRGPRGRAGSVESAAGRGSGGGASVAMVVIRA